MIMTNTHIWNIWEVVAIKYLQKKWYIICTTNFKFWRFWEIDIIAQKQTQTIFIEVKYRTNDRFWTPEESITSQKLHKLKKTIEYYCCRNNINFEYIQFDVIAIIKKQTSHQVTHYRNVEM